jgi:hypothetical protein
MGWEHAEQKPRAKTGLASQNGKQRTRILQFQLQQQTCDNDNLASFSPL